MERLTHTVTICGTLLCVASCQHEGPSAESSENAAAVKSETATRELPLEPVTPDAAQRAVAVGDQSPDFELQDQHGQRRALAEFLGKGKVALVFYRSADW